MILCACFISYLFSTLVPSSLSHFCLCSPFLSCIWRFISFSQKRIFCSTAAGSVTAVFNVCLSHFICWKRRKKCQNAILTVLRNKLWIILYLLSAYTKNNLSFFSFKYFFAVFSIPRNWICMMSGVLGWGSYLIRNEFKFKLL